MEWRSEVELTANEYITLCVRINGGRKNALIERKLSSAT